MYVPAEILLGTRRTHRRVECVHARFPAMIGLTATRQAWHTCAPTPVIGSAITRSRCTISHRISTCWHRHWGAQGCASDNRDGPQGWRLAARSRSLVRSDQDGAWRARDRYAYIPQANYALVETRRMRKASHTYAVFDSSCEFALRLECIRVCYASSDIALPNRA